MANINFTQLPDSTNLQATDIFPIVRGNTTDYKASGSYIPTFLGFANVGSGFSLTRGTGPVTLSVLVNSALNQNLLTTSSPTFAVMNVTSQYQINAVSVLTGTTLGPSVVNSSLTKVGLNSAGYVKTDALGNLSSQTGVPVTDLTQASATGNIYYGNGTTLTSLPIGANGQFLSIIGGIPAWGSSGTMIPNPLVVGVITIDGTGGGGGNKITSASAQPFYMSAAVSQLIALQSQHSTYGVVSTITNPYTNDVGAVYVAGTNVNAAGAGAITYGRHHIITGAVVDTDTTPFLAQSGGISTFARIAIGTYEFTFPNGLFRTAPYGVATIRTNVLNQNAYVFTRKAITTTSIIFVTETPSDVADGLDFNFVIVGAC